MCVLGTGFGQLLGDGTGTAGTSACDVFYRCEKPLEVYTMVTVKTFVFSIDEGLDDNGGDIFVLDRSSVLAEKRPISTLSALYISDASLVTGF